jgi:threonine synthase
MVNGFSWVCPHCGWRGGRDKYYWRCPRCGSPLGLEYERKWEPDKRVWGMARYSSMLPLKPLLVLGEGGTPLVERRISGLRMLFKLEYLNPTGSFKDRGTSLALAYARSLGYGVVVEDTSGNTGASVAAYASALGMKSRIYMPRTAPEGKKSLVRLLGGEVVEAPSRGEAAEMVLEEAGKRGVFYVAHTWSPFYVEAPKTIVFEAYEQGARPAAVVAPVGSGGLLLGLYKGFKELVEEGLAERLPVLVAVQGYSNAPVYRAFYGREPGEARDSSLADGIMVPKPPRLDEIVSAVRDAGGCVVLVGNEEIKASLRMLAGTGLVVEPTSATVVAGARKALEEGCIDRGDTVLAPLTGSGLKMADILSRL